MQSSLTTYFKAKKRVRDSQSSTKGSAAKLLGLSAPASPTTLTDSHLETKDSESERKNAASPIPINADVSTASETSEVSSHLDISANEHDKLIPNTPASLSNSPLIKEPPSEIRAQPTAAEKFVQETQNQHQLNSIKKLVQESRASTSHASNLLLSPKKTISIHEKQFYSPQSNANIFTSPVKLSEIKSPLKLSPASRAAAKRLFNTLSKSPVKSSANNNGSANNESENEDDSPSPKKIPAYQRFHHLAQKTPDEISDPSPTSSESIPVRLPSSSSADLSSKTAAKSGSFSSSIKSIESQLQLPYKFKVLEELFQAIETVSSIYHNRNESITFSKLKPAVHELMRRVQVKEKHVEQILTVFPGAYTVALDKIKSSSSTGQQKLTYELTMTINLQSTLSISERLSPAVITARRRIFHENLLKICHEHHEAFLGSLVPKIDIPSNKKVTRWHPKFLLDDIPDINPIQKLPQAPESSSNQSTARDVISKAQNILDNANPRMKKALAELLKKQTQEKEKSTSGLIPTQATSKTQQKDTAKTMAALKGLSQGLIDKIRAREQEKIIRTLTLTPEETKKNLMIGRLPDLVKSIRNTMVSEKKSALPLGLLVERLSHSNHGMLTTFEVEDHVRLLCKVLPSWASILKLTQGEYLKINKDTNINDLLEKFNERQRAK